MSLGKDHQDYVIENEKLKTRLDEAQEIVDDWDKRFAEVCSDLQDAIDILSNCIKRKP